MQGGLTSSRFVPIANARAGQVEHSISVIIPAHNEQARIRDILTEYAKSFSNSEIIVVLNGCTDQTPDIVAEIASSYNHIIILNINHAIGKGGAIIAGFSIASGSLVGYVDADGATSPEEMLRLFGALGEADGIIASRWLPDSVVNVKQSRQRRIASRVFNMCVRILFGLKYQDTQCGAKVFRHEALNEVIGRIETANMSFDVDLLYRLKMAGKNVREAPTVWNDVAGSKVNLLPSSLQMLRGLLRLRLKNSFLRIFVPLFDHLLPTRTMRFTKRFSILILNWRDIKNPLAGGAELYLHEVAKRWVLAGAHVEWLTASFPGAAKREVVDGVHVRRVGNKFTVYGQVPLTYLVECRDRFDAVVDAENGIPFFSPLFSLKPKICLMFHVHRRVFLEHLPFPISWLFVWIESWLMPRVYQNVSFVAISDDTRLEMERRCLSKREIDVIESGLAEYYSPGTEKAATPLITYCGRLKEYKRVDRLIRAFASLLSDSPTARLAIAGTGDDQGRLRAICEDLQVGDRVDFLGFITEQAKVDLLRKSWIFVSPSSMEGWGLAVVEANACGTPAVVFDVPGLRTVVKDGHNGFVVPDSESLEPALRALISDDALRKQMSERSVETAAKYSWDRASSEFLDLLMLSSSERQNTVVRLRGEWTLLTRQKP